MSTASPFRGGSITRARPSEFSTRVASARATPLSSTRFQRAEALPFTVYPGTRQYDALHTHQSVEVRYLPRRDLPNLPLTKILWEMHALPTVRLGNFTETTKLQAFLTPKVVLVCKVLAGLATLLIVLRILRSRLFAWVAGIAVVVFLAVMLLQDFPRPTPAPLVEVRQGTGHVKSLGQI